ncbi:hypothetical protein AB3X93_32000, partial [Paraburkholderia sp. BR14262]|uniref:hypothetical protein n=1 Tax=Paraburkholderia sp. BR14262 TaxID=3236999 RepID=UPI0034CD0611
PFSASAEGQARHLPLFSSVFLPRYEIDAAQSTARRGSSFVVFVTPASPLFSSSAIAGSRHCAAAANRALAAFRFIWTRRRC